MRNFAGLLKPVVFTIKQVGRQVLFLLNNKRLIKNKYQTRNCSLQTVNYKWSWENIQCVKDFPTVLLALYKRGRAILFWSPFRWHSFSRNLSLVVFVDKKKQQYRSLRLPPFFSASIHERRVALSMGHPRGTHSRYVIGCCLIPLGIYGLKNNSRRITYGIGCV